MTKRKKQGCSVLAQIPSLALLRLLLTHTWPSPPRSVRSVGKVAAVTRVTHNAQNNKGEKRSRKKPENLENSFLSFSRLRSVSLTVGEGLAKECPQVVPGKAAVGTVPLEALEPIDDLILVEIGLHAGIVRKRVILHSI